MSDKERPDEPPKVTSVFAESEEPDEDANIVDEAPEEEDDGHLKKTVSTDGQDLYDHSQEVEAEREKQQADGVAPPDMPDREMIGVRNPGMMTDPGDEIRDEVERRFKEEFGEVKVEVSSEERDAFVRAALHDQDMVFNVLVEGVDALVKVVIPPDVFTNAAAAAANKWAQEDYIDSESDLQWLLTFQQMHAWYQVREINGEPTEWSKDWEDGMPRLSELRRKLLEQENIEPLMQMSAVRWRLVLTAIRIAEQKYKICLMNWQDRTFFTGADTA